MDGIGHGGFARGQTKDLRKGLKTREGRAKLTSFKQLPAPLLTPFSQTQVCPACASHVSHPIHFAWGGLVSSFSRHRRENIVLVKDYLRKCAFLRRTRSLATNFLISWMYIIYLKMPQPMMAEAFPIMLQTDYTLPCISCLALYSSSFFTDIE